MESRDFGGVPFASLESLCISHLLSMLLLLLLKDAENWSRDHHKN